MESAGKGLTRELIALRVARELRDGMYVNLGFGLPTLVCNFLGDREVVLHAQQGVLGCGSILADERNWDIDLLNASAQPINVVPGACFTDMATSFVMVRGRFLDVCVMGAYQVSETGDIANWQRGGERVGAIGGAMELANGAKRVIVAMEHTTSSGEFRIVKKCSYALTAQRAVSTIVTNLAYIDVTADGLVLREVAPGVTVRDVQAATEPQLIVSPELKEMDL